jgi:hypothetical protein
MSLNIDSRSITGVYALGQWFEIEPDSFGVDAFELQNWAGDADDVARYGEEGIDSDLYVLGTLYSSSEPTYKCDRPAAGSRCYSKTPQGCDGVCFIEKGTNTRVSLSLMEIKAFREDRGLIKNT